MDVEQLDLDFRKKIIIDNDDLDEMLLTHGLNDFTIKLYHQKIYESHTPEQVRDWYNTRIGPEFKKLLSERKLSLYVGVLASLFKSQKKLQGRHGEKFKTFYAEHAKIGQEYLDVDDLEIIISKRYLKRIIN